MKRFAKHMLAAPANLALLALQRRRPTGYSRLRTADSLDLAQILESPALATDWAEASRILKRPPGADEDIVYAEGALNDGDRRALYYLVRALCPRSVLEIGTHLGSSTAHIAFALRRGAESPGRLTTVDIKDVNDSESAPWRAAGLAHSPRRVVQMLGMGANATFRVQSSVEFLESTDEKYDFAFLDGSHAASSVYNEVQLVQHCLNPGAVVLLHDYFPSGRPIWTNSHVIPGPYLAVRRLLQEGAPLKILPLGELPWPTKQGSNATSLALLLRDERSGPAVAKYDA